MLRSIVEWTKLQSLKVKFDRRAYVYRGLPREEQEQFMCDQIHIVMDVQKKRQLIHAFAMFSTFWIFWCNVVF